MAITPIPYVHPGDLISATFFNQVIDAIAALQAQIDALPTEGTATTPGGPVIIQILPEKARAGAPITIIGKNFTVPAFLNKVRLTNIPSATFESKLNRELDDIVSGTDTTIVVGVPGDIPSLPRTLMLSVETSAGKAEHPVLIDVPKVEVKGTVKVLNVTNQLGNITVGQTYTFNLQLDATALNVAERFTIEVNYANAVGAKAEDWKAQTTLVGATASSQVLVDPKEPVKVGVAFVVPAGAKSVDMTVRAVSVTNDPDSSGSSPVIPIAVGKPPAPTDDSIALTLKPPTTTVAIRSAMFPSGQGLEVAFNKQGLATVHVSVGHGGSYVFDAAIEDDDGSWSVINLPRTVSMGDADTSDQKFALKLQAAPTKDVTRFLNFSAKRTDKSGVGEISNYLRFPIGGFVVGQE